MAIVFPRELINYHMSECWFDLIDNISSAASNNGLLLNLSQISDPIWKGRFMTGILTPEEQAIWSAWRKSLRGGLRTFIAYDVRRRAPFAYPTAKVPGDIKAGWNGQASVTSLGLSGVLGLADLPENYQFKVGDRIGLVQNSRYGYHEIVEDVIANGAGVATVTVTPFLFTSVFTNAAVAQIWQPKCQVMIDAKTWSESGTKEPSAVSFEGYQKL